MARPQGNDTKTLADGTVVTFCSPHHSWEWECEGNESYGCGHVNSQHDLTCDDCGKARVK